MVQNESVAAVVLAFDNSECDQCVFKKLF